MSDELYNSVAKVGVLGAIKDGMFDDLDKSKVTRLKVIAADDGLVNMVQAAYVTEVVGTQGRFTIDYSSDSEKYFFIGPPLIKCFAAGDDSASFNDRIQVNIDFDSRGEETATGVAFRGPDSSGSSVAYRPAPAGTKIYAMVWATVYNGVYK